MLSIVIPTYNEATEIGTNLDRIFSVISPDDEVIIVDGFSEDRTQQLVNAFPRAKLITSGRGRATQMNRGAREVRNGYILFLHADTLLNRDSVTALKAEITSGQPGWGWFPINLNSTRLVFRAIEAVANLRTNITKTPLGDHGIFVRKDVFERAGGFPEIGLMEDIEFIKRVRRISKGVRVNSPIQTSVRRFEKSGIFRTLFTMWYLRVLYSVGISPDTLARRYGNVR